MFLPKQLQNPTFNFIPLEGKDPSINGTGWQKQIHSYHEAEGWLALGLNYGVMGGHGGLIIMDADAEAVSLAIETTLPATFTVKSGSGKKHYYFFCPEIQHKIVLWDKIVPCLWKEGEDHYGEVISWGGQAVGPGSIHPETQKYYEVFKDLEISTISKDQLLAALAIFLKPVAPDIIPPTHTTDNTISNLKISDVINIRKTGTIIHPIHGAKNGGNLNLDLEKNVWRCFRCDSGGGPISLLAVMEGIIECIDAQRGSLRGEKFIQTAKIVEQRFGIKAIEPKKVTPAVPVVPAIITPPISFSELMAQVYPDARYIVEPFFEHGTVNMVSAPPNTWKSWLLFYFSAHIAEGKKILDNFTTEKSKIMIVNEEDSHRAVQDRFKALGIVGELPIYFHIAKGIKIEKNFIQTLIKDAKEKDITVIMFDSLRSMHQAEENDSTEMQVILDQLKDIAREGITVVFTHHHRKRSMFSKGDDAEASRGSSAINAAISGHLSLEEEEREGVKHIIVRHLKSKAGKKHEPFEIKIEEKEGGCVAFSYAGDFKSGEKKLVQAKNSIMDKLSSGTWMTKKDFIGLAGDKILRQAIESLKNTGLIRSISRKQADKERIQLNSTGKSNELVYKIIETEENQENGELW